MWSSAWHCGAIENCFKSRNFMWWSQIVLHEIFAPQTMSAASATYNMYEDNNGWQQTHCMNETATKRTFECYSLLQIGIEHLSTLCQLRVQSCWGAKTLSNSHLGWFLNAHWQKQFISKNDISGKKKKEKIKKSLEVMRGHWEHSVGQRKVMGGQMVGERKCQSYALKGNLPKAMSISRSDIFREKRMNTKFPLT